MRNILGLLAATALAFSFTSSLSFAEEKLDNYIYNDDGTYQKVGTEPVLFNGAGYLEVEYGRALAHSNGASASFWGMRGSYGATFGSDWHAQGNLGFIESGEGTASLINLSVHVSKKFSENTAVGVFARGGALSNGAVLQDSYGVEGVIYGEKTTLMGTLGYSNAVGSKIAGSVSGRYYFSDNARMTAQAALGGNFWSLAAKASYRMEKFPNTTVFAGYQYYTDDVTASPLSIVRAGLRFNFGSTSLRDEEQNGVRWQTHDGF